MKFILLLRPVNLLIIALTMYVTKLFLVEAILTGNYLIELRDIYEIPKHYELNFFFLVMMVVFLAAGGNIINDYFDVRADRINKPKKTYIDYHVSRQLAIKAHIVFTSIAILLSLYLWMVTDSYWPVIFSFSIAVGLWLYSAILKRKFLIGNFVIAVLTGIVPFIAYTYFVPILSQYENTSLDFTLETVTFKLVPFYDTVAIVGVLCFFAFITNFIREMIKDINDIVGDTRVGCRTVPIVLGIVITKTIISFLLFLCISVFLFPFVMWPKTMGVSIILYPFTLIIILLALTMIFLIMARKKNQYKMATLTLKLVMIIGILLPVILNYGTNKI